MNFLSNDLSAELEAYLKDNNPSMQLSLEEALERGAIPVFREFTFETMDLKQHSDKYSFFGECSLRIEQVFSALFLEYEVRGFTPYKVTQMPITFGLSFKVETMLVIEKG